MGLPSLTISSLSGQAFLKGASSRILNTPDEGQGRFNRYLGKPLRAIARYIYAIAVSALAGIAGFFYHFAAAAHFGIKKRQAKTPAEQALFKEKAICHLISARQDSIALGSALASIATFGLANVIALIWASEPNKTTAGFHVGRKRETTYSMADLVFCRLSVRDLISSFPDPEHPKVLEMLQKRRLEDSPIFTY